MKAGVEPHIAKLQSEKFRIFGQKGEIRQTDDSIHRVFLRGRIYPGMKTTRSIGDLLAHQIGVTSEPSFKYVDVNHTDKFLIVGVDCLWDNFSSHQELIDFIAKMPVSEKDVHGSISDKIYQKVRD